MNFFNHNPQQDKYFIEISYKLKLAYWLAADTDHFVEHFPELITKKEISNINNNSITIKKLYEEANKKIILLKGDHKDCAILLSKYIKHTIDIFLSESTDFTGSESEETYLNKLLQIDEDFRQSYKNYFCFSDPDSYQLRAFSKLSDAYISMTNFQSFLGSKDEITLADKALKSILDNLNIAYKLMQKAIVMTKETENSTKDFFIAYKSNEKYSADDFYNMQLEYSSVWCELLFVYKEFYLTLQNSQNFDFKEEYGLMLHETTKYDGKINELGIKISKIILEVMNESPPCFEILSTKSDQNPLKHLNLKLGTYD
jgi:hypothetical protein